MRSLWLAAALLALAGCKEASSYSSTEDMVDDLSSAAAEDAVSGVRTSVENHESRITELEAEIETLKSEMDTVEAQASSTESEVDLLQSRSHEHY